MKKPTDKMIAFAEAIAEKLDIDIDIKTLSFAEVSDLIDEFKDDYYFKEE